MAVGVEPHRRPHLDPARPFQELAGRPVHVQRRGVGGGQPQVVDDPGRGAGSGERAGRDPVQDADGHVDVGARLTAGGQLEGQRGQGLPRCGGARGGHVAPGLPGPDEARGAEEPLGRGRHRGRGGQAAAVEGADQVEVEGLHRASQDVDLTDTVQHLGVRPLPRHLRRHERRHRRDRVAHRLQRCGERRRGATRDRRGVTRAYGRCHAGNVRSTPDTTPARATGPAAGWPDGRVDRRQG